MSVRKSSHGTIFLIVSSGSPRALIASSLRSTSKKPVCPMTRSLHPPMTAHDHRVRFVATWREEFFEVPIDQFEFDELDDDLKALLGGSDQLRTEEQMAREIILNAIDPIIALGAPFRFEEREPDDFYISIDV